MGGLFPRGFGLARRDGARLALIVILCVAAGPRFFELGRLSFWYDEVVSLRLARAGGPAGLFKRLFEIDATRAPVHPLLLSGWIGLFGPSETAARSFSVVCGLAAIAVIHGFGRAAFGVRAGLWAAWLAALSPILIVYSREARMYSWLVLVACIAWRSLLALRQGGPRTAMALYIVAIVVIIYSHPLGMIMTAAIAAAGFLDAKRAFGGLGRWLVVHLAALALVAPWLRFYLDHDPEFTSGRLSPRFLLGTPIGFIGGNFALQPVLLAIIVWGVVCHSREPGAAGEPARDRWWPVRFLLIWLIAPPVVLYVYSLVFHPVFGPARYTAFCAPAFLILVGLGLASLPVLARYPLALGLAVVSGLMLHGQAYDPELKADWRGLEARAGGLVDPATTLVIVVSADRGRNVEVETARYYLPPGWRVVALQEAAGRLEESGIECVFLTVPGRRGMPRVAPPASIGGFRFERDRRFEVGGLIVYLGVRGVAAGAGLGAPGSSTGSARPSSS